MIKNNKKVLLFTTTLLSLSLFLGTGCTNKSAKNPPANNNATEQKATENKDNMTAKTEELNNRSQKIANEVTKIGGIDKSRVLISEKRALVGVSIPNSSEGKITNDLKKKVEDTVKKTDKEITHVAVSADADIYDRINRLGDGMKQNKGMEKFGDEFKEIFNRIIPQ